MNQRKTILQAEKVLDCGPVELARKLNTPYDTFKSWKNERITMPGVACLALEMIIERKSES